MRTGLAVSRVIVFKSRGVDKTGGPFFKNTSLEPGSTLRLPQGLHITVTDVTMGDIESVLCIRIRIWPAPKLIAS
jgi:hypothetical protein